MTAITDLDTDFEDTVHSIVGTVGVHYERLTKNNKPYAVTFIEDSTGTLKITHWGQAAIAKTKQTLTVGQKIKLTFPSKAIKVQNTKYRMRGFSIFEISDPIATVLSRSELIEYSEALNTNWNFQKINDVVNGDEELFELEDTFDIMAVKVNSRRRSGRSKRTREEYDFVSMCLDDGTEDTIWGTVPSSCKDMKITDNVVVWRHCCIKVYEGKRSIHGGYLVSVDVIKDQLSVLRETLLSLNIAPRNNDFDQTKYMPASIRKMLQKERTWAQLNVTTIPEGDEKYLKLELDVTLARCLNKRYMTYQSKKGEYKKMAPQDALLLADNELDTHYLLKIEVNGHDPIRAKAAEFTLFSESAQDIIGMSAEKFHKSTPKKKKSIVKALEGRQLRLFVDIKPETHHDNIKSFDHKVRQAEYI